MVQAAEFLGPWVSTLRFQCESISKWHETDSACGSMVDPYFKLTTKLVLNLLLHTGLHTHTTNVLEPL